MSETTISVQALRRLPQYLRFVKVLRAQGREVVSCRRISEELGVDPTLVRKDLASAGISGRAKVGYRTDELVAGVSSFLGWDNTTDAILVGAGNLGLALLGYEGFREYGLNIVAAFDNDPDKIGQEFHGKTILDQKKMTDLVERMHIQIGVLAVPAPVAAEMATMMVLSGIRGIWNFTPVKLEVPESVAVESINLASSLAVLSNRLASVTEPKKGNLA